MPKDKDLKRVVRARAERTGESYMTARRRVVAKRQTAPVLVTTPGLGALGASSAKTVREAMLAAGIEHAFDGPRRYTATEDIGRAVDTYRPGAVVLAVTGMPTDSLVLVADAVARIRETSSSTVIAISADVFHQRDMPMVDALNIDALVAVGLRTGDIWEGRWASESPESRAALFFLKGSPDTAYERHGPWTEFCQWLLRRLTK